MIDRFGQARGTLDRWSGPFIGASILSALIFGPMLFGLSNTTTLDRAGFAAIWLLLIVYWTNCLHKFSQKKEQERSARRARDEMMFKQQEEAAERARARQERYRALRRRVLEDLEAIGRGEQMRLSPEALNAAKALRERQGSRAAADWSPVINDLSVEILDPEAMRRRLNDLLYPETLEDVDALKKRVQDDVQKVSAGKKSRLDPEALKAAAMLREITERKQRKAREEWEAEIVERREEEARDREFLAAMDELTKNSTRNTLRAYGQPETALDGLSPEDALAHIKALRKWRELELDKKSDEERERIISALEEEWERRHLKK
jgi:hypothetical protein